MRKTFSVLAVLCVAALSAFAHGPPIAVVAATPAVNPGGGSGDIFVANGGGSGCAQVRDRYGDATARTEASLKVGMVKTIYTPQSSNAPPGIGRTTSI